MDNILNRPLFRRREARDRLNDMAGVQGYQDGGPVFESGGRQPVRPAGLPSMLDRLRATGAMAFPMLMPMAAAAQAPETLEQRLPEVMRGLDEGLSNPDLPPNERRALEEQRSVLSTALEGGRGVAEAVTDAAALLTRLQGKILQGASPAISAVSPELGSKYLEYTDVFDRVGDTLATAVPEELPPELRPGQPRAERPLEAAIGAANRPTVPSGVGGARPEGPAAGLPAAVIGGARPEAEATGLPAAPGTAAQGPSFEGTGRGAGPLVTSPAEVAAGLNAPDPAVREKTAADFMQEFMANAPKYEGGDKKLMHAMIGFAIAAGDSPNAMTNIARGLLAGSEMMLKDKAAKDEFDRQVQLSAMEYGLQETTKQRDRAKQALSFVALEDTTYNGRPVKRGEQVYIPYGEIEKNGGVVPPGFGDTALVTAISEREKGLMEALETARKENLVDDTFVEGQRETFSKAAGNAIAAQRGIDYMEAAILKVGEEGNIAGLEGALDTIVGNVAAAAGLKDVNAQFSDRQQVEGLVKKAFQNLIPAALSGVQTANSISNRDIEILAQAYVDSMLEGGVFSMATITEDKLLNSMKSALDLLQGSRQQALTDMSAVERTISGRTLRSGESALSVIEPYRALIPGQDEVGVPSRLGNLYLSEDGVYEIMRPGG